MTCSRFVKGGCNHFAAHSALHFCDLFRALVDQQNHEVNIGVVGGDGVRNVLHHDGFARLGLRHNEGALTFANWGNDVDHTAGDVLVGLDVAL